MNRLAAALAVGSLLLVAPVRSAPGQARPFTVVEGSAPRDPTNTLPLKTTRIVRFTTDEGTWMSLSVSPDGRTILFDLLGDLYTLPISGGKATRILGGNAMDVQPTYSPDGKKIAFMSDRSGSDQAWVANADGSNPIRISNAVAGWISSISYPSWTPDGEYVLLGPTLYHLAGGEGIKAPYSGSPASYTKDGDRVYYGSGTIMVYDRATGKSRAVLSRPGGALHAAVSPDGKKLVYFTRTDVRTDLMMRDLETGDDKLLKAGVQHDAGQRSAGYGTMPRPAWLPDGSAVLTTWGGKIWKVDVATAKATMIPFTADVEQYLGPLSRFQYPITDTFTVRQIRDVALSPDAKQLAFTALDKLYLTSLAGGMPKRVTNAVGVVEHSPSWSPDGKHLVFATWTDENGGQLYRVNADGSGVKQLTAAPAFYVKPVYSPDGKRIAVATGPWVPRRNYVDRLTGAQDEGPLSLAWMDADGGELHEIVDLGGGVSALAEGAVFAHFGPQPDRILFGGRGLESVRWDGSDRKVLVQDAGVTLSPTGAYGFATNRSTHRIYIFPVPAIGSSVQLTPTGEKPGVPTEVAIDIGGEFPGWSKDGKYMYFALGHAFYLYDVAAAMKARSDSLQLAWQKKLAGDTLPVLGEDTLPYRQAYTPQRFDIVVKADAIKPHGVVALKGARLLTMKGHEVIESGDLVITDNRITAIGPSGSVTIPSGAKVIDVSGKTIIPGYVDVHAHSWPSFDVHKTTVPAYHAYMSFGLTTPRDPQTNTSDFLTYSDRMRTGDLFGPRLFGTGQGIFNEEKVNTLQRARDVVGRYAEFFQTETVKQYLTGNRRTRQLMIMATRELRITPTTEGAGDFKMSVTEMLDGYSGHEHAYEIWPLYKDVVYLAAASGITYTPTLLVAYGGPENKYYMIEREKGYDNARLRRFTFQPDLAKRTRGASWNPEDEYIFKGVSESGAKIVAAGGMMGVGAHHEVQGIGTPWDLTLLSQGGMPLYDVLRVGTIFGATSIGLDRDLGSLEVGKLADLIVLNANPLTNIRNILDPKYVMRNGFLYESETLDEVWPEQKKLPVRWWQTYPPSSTVPRASSK